MITQIEIDGFKTFKDFKVELAPFQVIVGANGSGKSNLFDALQLLGRLASYDLLEAFQGLRGDANELFTRLPDGQLVRIMRFAVEMLLDYDVKNDVGRKVKLKYTRLRYELEIIAEVDEIGLEQLYIHHEALKTITRTNDSWIKRHNVLPEWLPQGIAADDEVSFITTGEHHKSIDGQDYLPMNEPIITVFREDQSQGNSLQYRARDLRCTALNTVRGAEYLAIAAIRTEILSWKFMHLDPEEIRKPSPIRAPRSLSSRGGNLPATLMRMQHEDKFALASVSRDLAYLVPDAIKVEVRRDPVDFEYSTWVETQDRRTFPASVLSDGTLRLLALATIKNDLQFRGVLCLEEPENGVNPLSLDKMTSLLKIIATDFSDSMQSHEPLTQILITTHSPLLASQPATRDALLFASLVTLVLPGEFSFQITSMKPVLTSVDEIAGFEEERSVSGEIYTIDQIIKYLDGEVLNTVREEIERTRKVLDER